MPLNFPSSPALNATHSVGDRTWKWNGTGWQLLNSNAVVAGAVLSVDYGLITTASDADYDYGALA